MTTQASKNRSVIAGLLGVQTFSLATFLSGCLFGDPGLIYRVPGWKTIDEDGRWYEEDVDGRVRVRVHDAGFGATFGVRIRITNMSSEDVVFDGSALYLTDRNGTRLSSALANPTCEPSPAQRLRPGETLESGCGFSSDIRKMAGDIFAVQPGLVSGSWRTTLAIPLTTRF
jgi:hypothetical protein